jgi:hypothetical protein
MRLKEGAVVADQDNESLEALLAEIEAEISERQAAADFIRKRLGRPSDEGRPVAAGSAVMARGGSSPGQIRRDAFFGMKIPQAIRSYLEIMKSPQSPKAINDGLMAGGLLTNSTNFYTTMWTALKRLEDSGDVVNTKNGYGLALWYPSRPKGPDTRKPKRKRGRPRKTSVANVRPASAPGPRLLHGETIPMESHKSAYHAFLAAEMGKGKSMKEAAAAWQRDKTSG